MGRRPRRARSPPATARSTPTLRATLAVSNVTGLGEITLRDNGTDVWDSAVQTTGLPRVLRDRAGGVTFRFPSLVEGTLARTARSTAMGGSASTPTGVSRSGPSMISDANQTGTGTVDGVAVTVYTIFHRSGSGRDIPGLNFSEQRRRSPIQTPFSKQRASRLDRPGLRRRLDISSTRSVAHFSDGSIDEQRVDLLRLRLCRDGADAGSIRSQRRRLPGRLTRHRRRPDDDHVDGPAVHHRALDGAADIHDCDRTAELDDVDDEHLSATNDDHRDGGTTTASSG